MTTVLDMQPNAIRHRDLNGQLPIHLAVAGGLQVQNELQPTVQHVYKDDPQAEADKAARKSQMLSILIENFVEALGMRDNHQRLPLHMAVESGNWAAVPQVVRAFPNAAARRNRRGVLPYAEAVQRGASPAALETLLEAFRPDEMGLPEAIMCKQWKRVEEIVMRLKPSEPGPAATPDTNGRIPLHHAAEYGCPEEIVIKLRNIFPAGVKVADIHGVLPTSIAAMRLGPVHAFLATEDQIGTILTPRGSMLRELRDHTTGYSL